MCVVFSGADADGKAGKVGSNEKEGTETDKGGEGESHASCSGTTCDNCAEQLCAADVSWEKEDACGDERNLLREGGGVRGAEGEQEQK